MKKAYGEYIFSNNKAIEIAKEMSPQELFSNISANVIEMCKDKPYSQKEILEEIGLHYNGNCLEIDAKNGKCIHYFFTGEGMYEWFLDCAAPLTLEQSKIIQTSETKNKSLAFMLHFSGGKSPTYLCRWIINGMDVSTGEIIQDNSLMVLQGKYHGIIWLRPNLNTDDNEIKTCLSVVSSALAYIQCFPDMVKNGIPEDLSNQNHYRKIICKSIGMHHSLIISHASPCPHYRIGHFRLLSSNKFVHKKGQIIFVHGTFVKGKAMTVEGVV